MPTYSIKTVRSITILYILYILHSWPHVQGTLTGSNVVYMHADTEIQARINTFSTAVGYYTDVQ